MTDAINSFTLAIDGDTIDDLHRQASDALAGTGNGRGLGRALRWTRSGHCVSTGAIATTGGVQQALNALGQYVIEIDGLDIHFLHVRSPHPDALPVIITHGRPGSVIESMKVIGPLTDPVAHGGDAADVFDVMHHRCPDSASQQSRPRRGGDVSRFADAWITLMARLGYDRWVAQGGDWGAAVTTAMASETTVVCGVHLNMPIVLPTAEAHLTPAEEAAVASLMHYQEHESGYAKQQSTRPQTLGYGLVDSPVAQAAWVYEKMWSWTTTGCPGGRVEPRRDPRQHHAVLVAGNWRIVGPAVLGELQASFGDSKRSTYPWAPASPPKTSLARLDGGRSATSPTSSTGTSSTVVATSPPGRNPTSSSTRSEPVSDTSADTPQDAEAVCHHNRAWRATTCPCVRG